MAAAGTDPAPSRRPWIVLAVLLALLLAVIVLAARLTYDSLPQLWLTVAAFAVFTPAVLVLRHLEGVGAGGRRMAQVVLGTSLLLQIAAVTGPPATSDDDWRYLWDGRVQVHGVDPYRYAARARDLVPLRTATIFPPQRPCQYHLFVEDGTADHAKNGCMRMNRPGANTVYPPVAEAFFAAAYVVTFGGHGNEFSLQVAAALGVMATGWLLYRRIRARGDPLWTLALWAWCPTVVIEASQNAHIDWLAVLLVAAAITVEPRRAWVRGLLLGAAVGVKLYPAVVGVAMVRRRPVVLIGAAAALFALSYVPHVLAVGRRVVGFLPTYLQQEDYSSGTRYLLISLLTTGRSATVVAVAVLLVVTGWALWRGDPNHPERAAVVLFGVAMLVATPNNPWYALMLVMLATLARRPEWLLLGLVMALYYLSNASVPDNQVVGRWGYIVAVLVIVGCTVARTVRPVRPVSDPPPATLPAPDATRPA